MGSPDMTLSPGDILRATVERIDGLDTCLVNAGAHGTLAVPLDGVAGTRVAKLVPGAGVCVQVTAAARGKAPATASIDIEFSGRTSVLVLDGAAITGEDSAAKPAVFVSKNVPAVRRAELSTRLESAFADDSCGLPSMIGVVNGPVRVILRTAADGLPWDQVLSAVVVQMTEAAAFTVLARADVAPALLMAERPDADGDALIGAFPGSYLAPNAALEGRAIALADGGEVLFERTESLWTATVRPFVGEEGLGGAACRVNEEAAPTVCEALREYDVHGTVAVRFLPCEDPASFERTVESMREAFGGEVSRISGVAEFSIVLLGL